MSTSTVYSNDDTYVKEDDPTTTHEYSAYLYVNSAASYQRETLIDFDLSSESNTLTAAILYLYVNDAIPNRTLTIRRCTSSWGETTTYWDNKPTVTATNQSTIITGGTNDVWVHANITDIIKDCIDNTNYGITIINLSATSGTNSFRSKDFNVGAVKPCLFLNYGDKFVDISGGSDSNSGNCWDEAYLTIDKGVDNISSTGDIHVGFGDYSAQTAWTADKDLQFICETASTGGTGTTGGGTGTATFPVTT